MINFSNGIALPLAYPTAEATGSFLLFENSEIYETLSSFIKSNLPQSDPFEKLALAFQRLDFPFLNNVPLNKALELRNKGYLQKFRVYLRELWQTTSQAEQGQVFDTVVFNFIDRLKSEYIDLETEWKNIHSELMVNAVVKGVTTGLTASITGQINMTMGAVSGVGLSLISGIADYRTFNRDRIKLEQNPLAVFIKLS